MHCLQGGPRGEARRRALADWLETSTTVMAKPPARGETRGSASYATQFRLLRSGDDLAVVGAVALAFGERARAPAEFALLEDGARNALGNVRDARAGENALGSESAAQLDA